MAAAKTSPDTDWQKHRARHTAQHSTSEGDADGLEDVGSNEESDGSDAPMYDGAAEPDEDFNIPDSESESESDLPLADRIPTKHASTKQQDVDQERQQRKEERREQKRITKVTTQMSMGIPKLVERHPRRSMKTTPRKPAAFLSDDDEGDDEGDPNELAAHQPELKRVPASHRAVNDRTSAPLPSGTSTTIPTRQLRIDFDGLSDQDVSDAETLAKPSTVHQAKVRQPQHIGAAASRGSQPQPALQRGHLASQGGKQQHEARKSDGLGPQSKGGIKQPEYHTVALARDRVGVNSAGSGQQGNGQARELGTQVRASTKKQAPSTSVRTGAISNTPPAPASNPAKGLYPGESEDGLELNIEPSEPLCGSMDAPTNSKIVTDTGTWYKWTQLVFDEKGSLEVLSEQSPQIRGVVKEANMMQMPQILFWNNVYPTGAERDQYMHQSIFNAAKARGQDEILRRLRADDEYARILATQPFRRMSHTRTNVLRATRACIKKAFGLDQFKTPDALVLAVKSLLEGNVFIFPGHFNKNGKYLFNRQQPMCSNGIIQAAHAAFFARDAAYIFPTDAYVSSIKTGEGADEPELPAPMIAFVATTVGTGLGEILVGAGHQAFRARNVDKEYINHVKTLTERSPTAYHLITAYLYEQASGDHGGHDAQMSTGQGNVYVDSDEDAIGTGIVISKRQSSRLG
ncbi:hypothetical protein BV25DRAFT_1917887 [Artomyces pyxidatus]|uniref:Uncharacterized protein n=1 Tax=Artomyces pyxidatus TaxID=48021 RepID=A0ACB8SUS8_9AGAM|nr:hypothetical protein BV25DRAFT_1917887 [Artomyces pyxidatus]